MISTDVNITLLADTSDCAHSQLTRLTKLILFLFGFEESDHLRQFLIQILQISLKIY